MFCRGWYVMSMTSQEYRQWCEAVTSTNKAMRELWDCREKNYKWMGDHLRKFFEDLGEVVNVNISSDASVIKVRMLGEVNLDADAFNSLPFNFKVTISEDMDLTFYLYPDVECYRREVKTH